MDIQDIMQFGAEMLNPQAAQKMREDEEEERRRRDRIARASAAAASYAPSAGLRGPAQFMGFANVAMAPGMTAHAGAVQQVNNAIAGEMQSRVAQAREARRMQHEKDMKKMELDAILERVRQARGY